MVNPFCITDYALGTYAVRWVDEADYEWTKQKRWKTEQTAMKSKRKPYVWGYVCGEGRERTTRLLQNFSAALSFVTKGCTPGCSRMNPCTSSPPQMPRGSGSVENCNLESDGLQLLEMAGKEDYEELRDLLQSWDVADLLPHLQGMYMQTYVHTCVLYMHA